MIEGRNRRFRRPATASLIAAVAWLSGGGCGTSEPSVPVLPAQGGKEDVAASIDNPLGAELKPPAGKKAAGSRPRK
jgi:hypothetical protein